MVWCVTNLEFRDCSCWIHKLRFQRLDVHCWVVLDLLQLFRHLKTNRDHVMSQHVMWSRDFNVRRMTDVRGVRLAPWRRSWVLPPQANSSRRSRSPGRRLLARRTVHSSPLLGDSMTKWIYMTSLCVNEWSESCAFSTTYREKRIESELSEFLLKRDSKVDIFRRMNEDIDALNHSDLQDQREIKNHLNSTS